MRLALLQFARKEELDENLRHAVELLSSVKDVDLVVLPENWASKRILSHDEHHTIVEELGKLAKARSYVVVAGAHYVSGPSEALSLGVALTPSGEAYEYDKHYPSSAIGERSFIRAGWRTTVFNVGGVKVGVVVCVDLMYPEVVRRLTLRGADVILNPSSIPADRISLWRAVGRARAAENTVFVASVNNTMTYYPDGRRVAGGSFVASPEGELILDAGVEEGVYVADLDLSHVLKVRSRWSFLEDVKRSVDKIRREYYRG